MKSIFDTPKFLVPFVILLFFYVVFNLSENYCKLFYSLSVL